MINSEARVDRRQERREQTRAALLDAAERLWAERGIHNASLDEIAGIAGLTKGAVYSNFTGKTDLLLALLDRQTQREHGLDLCEELVAVSGAAAGDAGASAGAAAGEEQSEPAGDRHRFEGDARLRALLLVEFWLYGMRDFAAGWRIADWYHARRGDLTRELTDADGVSAADRATMAMAMDLGLAIQHLLDPERVPAGLCASGMRLVLGPRPPDVRN